MGMKNVGMDIYMDSEWLVWYVTGMGHDGPARARKARFDHLGAGLEAGVWAVQG